MRHVLGSCSPLLGHRVVGCHSAKSIQGLGAVGTRCLLCGENGAMRWLGAPTLGAGGPQEQIERQGCQTHAPTLPSSQPPAHAQGAGGTALCRWGPERQEDLPEFAGPGRGVGQTSREVAQSEQVRGRIRRRPTCQPGRDPGKGAPPVSRGALASAAPELPTHADSSTEGTWTSPH